MPYTRCECIRSDCGDEVSLEVQMKAIGWQYWLKQAILLIKKVLLSVVRYQRARSYFCARSVVGKDRDKNGDLSQAPRRILREMAIDGLIILDSTNVKPIVQTSFRSFPPAFPLLHIDAYRAAFDKAARPEDIDPVLLVNLPDAPTACCHLQHRSLTFLCPISRDCEFVPWSQFTHIHALMPTKVDPLYAFAFIRTFLDILIEYFGEVTVPTLKDNFDIVHQLLEETLDAGGHPLTTSPNALRDIVLPPSLITKILSVTGVSGLTGPTTNNMSAFSSPIPWRKAGVRYNHNEIYFDIVETLDAVVNKCVHKPAHSSQFPLSYLFPPRNGTIVTSSVLGKIDVNCKLSGAFGFSRRLIIS